MDHEPARERQQGQIMVLFLLAIFAIIGMVGLVLDGGSVFAQRRDEQTVADLAAMAGATAYLNATGTPTRRSTATRKASRTSVATANGYIEGTTGVDLDLLDERRHVLQRGDRQPGEAAPQQLRRDPRHANLGRRCHSHRAIDVPGRTAPGARCRCCSTPRRSPARSATRRPDLHAAGLPVAGRRQRGRAAGCHPVQLDDLLHGKRQPLQRQLERRPGHHRRRAAAEHGRLPGRRHRAAQLRQRTPRSSRPRSTTRSGTCSRCRSSTTTA